MKNNVENTVSTNRYLSSHELNTLSIKVYVVCLCVFVFTVFYKLDQKNIVGTFCVSKVIVLQGDILDVLCCLVLPFSHNDDTF